MGLFFYTKKGSIISTVDLPTTEIIEPEKFVLHYFEEVIGCFVVCCLDIVCEDSHSDCFRSNGNVVLGNRETEKPIIKVPFMINIGWFHFNSTVRFGISF